MMVKGFWGALRIDLQRAFRLPFWLCSIWIAAIHIHSVWLSMVDAYGSVVAVYNEAVTVENYMQGLIPVLVSTVFSTAFLDDYQSEYYRFHLRLLRQLLYCLRTEIPIRVGIFFSTVMIIFQTSY